MVGPVVQEAREERRQVDTVVAGNGGSAKMIGHGRTCHRGAETVRARVPPGVGDDAREARLSQQSGDQRPVRAVRVADIGECYDSLLPHRLLHDF